MKQSEVLLLFFFLFLLSAECYSQTRSIPPLPSNLGALRSSLIEGDVQIKRGDSKEWIPAAINVPMKEEDKLWVPEAGKAELQFHMGTYLRCDQNTGLSLLILKNNSSQFYLSEGLAYLNFDAPKGSFLQFDTPVSSIGVYEKATFRVDVTDKASTRISVFEGILYAETDAGKTTVESGNILFIKQGGDAELAPLGPSDDWENWNKERDKKQAARRDSYRYLPEELRIYSNELEENGKWVHVKAYGYVWTPTVGISSGWAPYRMGRWVWMGEDYVWVSHERWGWAPYHYGRWDFTASVGWFWVPPIKGAAYWGPGYVGWVNTPAYVAWVPLAPGELYYGYGAFGPQSVNLIGVDIKTIKVGVYRNVHISGAVTIIDPRTFLTGRPIDIRIRENPFLTQKINAGRPLLTPEKLTRMPILKDIPEGRRPPQRISDIRINKIREYRPLVKEKDASAFRPKQPPPKLVVKPREIDKDRFSKKDFDQDKFGRKDVDKDKPLREEIDKIPPIPDRDKAAPKQDVRKTPPGTTAKVPTKQKVGKGPPKPDVRKRPPKRDLKKVAPKKEVRKSSSRPEEPKTPSKKDLDQTTP
jgi:hypothetical protein